jgi:hypothetical protein
VASQNFGAALFIIGQSTRSGFPRGIDSLPRARAVRH